MAIIGLVNIGLAFIPSSFAPYTMLTSWIDMSTVFVGGPLIIGSMLLPINTLYQKCWQMENYECICV